LLFGWLLLVPDQVIAQSSSLSLSVTPTLFDVSVAPGQEWRSSIRVINPNDKPLTVYARPVVLSSDNERGVGNFTPIFETEQLGITLAEWIEVSPDPVKIPPQETTAIPFSVPVPEEATPGGKYAAILITTQPLKNTSGASQIHTSQAVSALFFMRVEGDVLEDGAIRSFHAANRVVSRPENNFILRFENLGTVHLQPQGDITIFNMWGEKRGVIPVNQKTEFGIVMPDAQATQNIRKYNFSWTGEYSLLDIGRYRAEVTLGYGAKDKQFVTQTLYFWVIPIYGLLLTLGSVVLFILLLSWLVRLYVRRMLQLAGISSARTVHRASTGHASGPELDLTTEPTSTSQFQKFSLPIKVGWSDMIKRWQSSQGIKSYLNTTYQLLYDYRWFFIGLVSLVIIGMAVWWFYQAVAVADRAFESRVMDHQNTVTAVITAEDLYLEKLQNNQAESLITVDLASFDVGELSGAITLVNVSGLPGAAASLAYSLQAQGVTTVAVKADLERREDRSIIVYDSSQLAIAKKLSTALGGALLSVRSASTGNTEPMVVYVGTDVLSP